MARPFESAEKALLREVFEETGLTVTSAELKLVFETSLLYPTRTSVFEATVEGEPRGSWEGRVVSVSLEELEHGIMKTQKPVVDYLRSGKNE